jgi:hypothetical protein
MKGDALMLWRSEGKVNRRLGGSADELFYGGGYARLVVA